MEKFETPQHKDYSYPQKVWIAVGIASLLVVILLLAKAVFSVFLLILAGALIAIFFHALAGSIERKTKWNGNVCMLISVVGIIVIIALLFLLIGSRLQSQVIQLIDTLPTTIQNAKQRVSGNPLAQKILSQVSSQKTLEKTREYATTFFQTTFGLLGDIYVVVFVGIFFTAAPDTYRKGIIRLVPTKGKGKAEEILGRISSNLKDWLKGKFFAMFVVFVLTAIGLLILDMPLWLVLALIAGLLNFVPNFGPLLAMVPAVLVAFTKDPTTAAIVAGMYVFIQVLESNFITPMVQQRLVNIPPAMIIIAQVIIAPLTSAWGVILATPVVVILMVLLNQLYIQRPAISKTYKFIFRVNCRH
jgi:predicted PurR-regulated permease PerM